MSVTDGGTKRKPSRSRQGNHHSIEAMRSTWLYRLLALVLVLVLVLCLSMAPLTARAQEDQPNGALPLEESAASITTQTSEYTEAAASTAAPTQQQPEEDRSEALLSSATTPTPTAPSSEEKNGEEQREKRELVEPKEDPIPSAVGEEYRTEAQLATDAAAQPAPAPPFSAPSTPVETPLEGHAAFMTEEPSESSKEACVEQHYEGQNPEEYLGACGGPLPEGILNDEAEGEEVRTENMSEAMIMDASSLSPQETTLEATQPPVEMYAEPFDEPKIVPAEDAAPPPSETQAETVDPPSVGDENLEAASGEHPAQETPVPATTMEPSAPFVEQEEEAAHGPASLYDEVPPGTVLADEPVKAQEPEESDEKFFVADTSQNNQEASREAGAPDAAAEPEAVEPIAPEVRTRDDDGGAAAIVDAVAGGAEETPEMAAAPAPLSSPPEKPATGTTEEAPTEDERTAHSASSSLFTTPDVLSDDEQSWREEGEQPATAPSSSSSSSPFSPSFDAVPGQDLMEEDYRTYRQAHPHEQPYVASPPHHPPAAPPSRLALSYLYYHALEALYVNDNVSLFVQRARDTAPYGHARLNWLLGVLHAYGIGVPRSEREAIMYYAFAAMEGVPEAHMALGHRYQNGLGVPVSCESALAHYREAADAVAMTYDGTAANLEGVATTEVPGSATIQSGGGRGRGLSFFAYRDNLAHSDQARRMKRDLVSLMYQADLGNGQALLTLGYIYLKGNHQVRRDGRKAAAYFTQAVAKGVAEAYGALGNLYTAGDASTSPPLLRNLTVAYEHYKLGAAQKDSASLNGMGFLHAIGFLEKDAPRHPYRDEFDEPHRQEPQSPSAFSSSAAAAEGRAAGHTEPFFASTQLPDFETAARYFERSYIPESVYNLAVLHLYGRGVKESKEEAQRLFWNAARSGSVLARWQLALLLEEEVAHHPAQCTKALELFKETASYGSWRRGGGGGGRSAAATGAPTTAATVAGARTSHNTAPKGAASSTANSGTAPHTVEEYARVLPDIIDRLQAVEEALQQSDENYGPAVVSLASFVELLSLAETGDAASTWLAAQYADKFLDVAGREGDVSGEREGAVTLRWPSASAGVISPGASRAFGNPASSSSSHTASAFLSADAAAGELLFYLLRRTVSYPKQSTGTAHGAAYLRLGDFFYYGEHPDYGVDMARAMEYYRVAADVYHDPQALFNVGFMYQLGLHKAPRVTRLRDAAAVSPVLNGQENSKEAPEAQRAVWVVHADPPTALSAIPAAYLTATALANAWFPGSPYPTAQGVDVYLAWKYYHESLRREGRGWLAVQAALLSLNLQWSVRHFAVDAMETFLGSSPFSLARWITESIQASDDEVSSISIPPHRPARPSSASNAPSPLREERGSASSSSSSPSMGGAEDIKRAARDGGEADEEASGFLASVKRIAEAAGQQLQVVHSLGMARLAMWYAVAEQTILYGAIGVFVLALLLRHHAA